LGVFPGVVVYGVFYQAPYPTALEEDTNRSSKESYLSRTSAAIVIKVRGEDQQ